MRALLLLACFSARHMTECDVWTIKYEMHKETGPRRNGVMSAGTDVAAAGTAPNVQHNLRDLTCALSLAQRLGACTGLSNNSQLAPHTAPCRHLLVGAQHRAALQFSLKGTFWYWRSSQVVGHGWGQDTHLSARAGSAATAARRPRAAARRRGAAARPGWPAARPRPRPGAQPRAQAQSRSGTCAPARPLAPARQIAPAVQTLAYKPQRGAPAEAHRPLPARARGTHLRS